MCVKCRASTGSGASAPIVHSRKQPFSQETKLCWPRTAMLEMEQWRATAQCVQVRLFTTRMGFHAQNYGGVRFAGRHWCVMILTVTLNVIAMCQMEFMTKTCKMMF